MVGTYLRGVVEPTDLLSLISLFLAYSGVLVIAYGGVMALAQTIIRGIQRGKGITFTRIRGEFARKIIFGLDFLIASDIVSTITAPNIDEVLRLGGIVLIRSVLTFLLSKETAELRAEEKEMGLITPETIKDQPLHGGP
jgi:uncharacterized membrane protein